MIDQEVRQPVRVLAVCTANISRSPAVERLLDRGLAPWVQVGSAGLASLVGEPIDPPVARFLGENGAEVAGFASRQLTESLVREADLVLALTREHRAGVVRMVPGAVRKTFTLLEFSRVLAWADRAGVPTDQTPGDRLRQMIPLVVNARALAPVDDLNSDDVPDPFGRGDAAYQASLGLIFRATASIIMIARGD